MSTSHQIGTKRPREEDTTETPVDVDIDGDTMVHRPDAALPVDDETTLKKKGKSDGLEVLISLKCGICLSLSKDPHMSKCCAALWCKACFTEARRRTGDKCPHCRASVTDSTLVEDLRAKIEIDAFIVPCPHAMHGCVFRDCNKRMMRHAESCAHRPKDEIIAALQDEVELYRSVYRGRLELQSEVTRRAVDVLARWTAPIDDLSPLIYDMTGPAWAFVKRTTVVVSGKLPTLINPKTILQAPKFAAKCTLELHRAGDFIFVVVPGLSDIATLTLLSSKAEFEPTVIAFSQSPRFPIPSIDFINRMPLSGSNVAIKVVLK